MKKVIRSMAGDMVILRRMRTRINKTSSFISRIKTHRSVHEEKIDRDILWSALYLAFCAAEGKIPDTHAFLVKDYNQLYEFCQFHSLTALVYESLRYYSQAGIDIPNLNDFKAIKDQSMIKNMMLDMERENLFAFMEERGIWYLPLKGIILKNMYPKMGLRQMCDNDILFDSSFRTEIRDWFLARGYASYPPGEDQRDKNDDHYIKLPYASFEMHNALFVQWDGSRAARYYKSICDRMVKDKDHRFGYHLRDEDFYLFMVAHAYKHYRSGGLGLRHLADIDVFLLKRPLDWHYVKTELNKLGMRAFEERCRLLSKKISSMTEQKALDELTLQESRMLTFLASSGTYGVEKHIGKMALLEDGLSHYLLEKIFPPKERLNYYKVLRESSLPLPIKWVWRWGILLIKRPDTICEEVYRLYRHIKHRKYD